MGSIEDTSNSSSSPISSPSSTSTATTTTTSNNTLVKGRIWILNQTYDLVHVISRHKGVVLGGTVVGLYFWTIGEDSSIYIWDEVCLLLLLLLFSLSFNMKYCGD
jgi:hypothetical protein